MTKARTQKEERGWRWGGCEMTSPWGIEVREVQGLNQEKHIKNQDERTEFSTGD